MNENKDIKNVSGAGDENSKPELEKGEKMKSENKENRRNVSGAGKDNSKPKIIVKALTVEELHKLLSEIKAELATREQRPLVLYTHPCKNSASYHLRKYKHWAKVVDTVDTTKTNGYAFGGRFISVESEHKLPIGTIVVEVCDNNISAFRLTADGKELITSGYTRSMSGLIEVVAEEVKK